MISKKINLSVVVPYFNEEKNILRTLKSLNKQTYSNFEVILINSNSSDNSFNIVNNWISKNKSKIKYKNLNKKSFLPSTSKNIGIKCSSGSWIAFMDVDLKFSKFWLETQINFLKKHKSLYVMGLCHFKGFDFYDECYVAQTWGYNSKIPVIPSSVFHKSLFRKFGYFQKTRAGYDKVWKKNLQKNSGLLLVNNNLKTTVRYNKFNHSDNFSKFLKKIFNYAKASFKVKNNIQPIIYLLAFLFFFIILFTKLYLGIIFFLIYFILRSFIFPFIKSKEIRLSKIKALHLLFLPIVGIGIDITRIIAYFLALLTIR